MSKLYDSITPELQAWVERQRLFFVATAPTSAGGHINCSPKGLDSLRVLGPLQVTYLDLTGSGAETIAHVRENGRIVVMLCAFDGPPRIVRFHGVGRVVTPGDPAWGELYAAFAPHAGARAIVVVDVQRVSDSCGFAVPEFDFVRERDTLTRWADNKGAAALDDYRRQKNAVSIDGLPALDPD